MTRTLLIASTLWLASFTSAFAQDPASQAQDAQDQRATEFRAMQGPAHESVPGGTLMIAGYACVWFFVFAYLTRIGLLSSKTGRELDRLSGLVRKKGDSPKNEA